MNDKYDFVCFLYLSLLSASQVNTHIQVYKYSCIVNSFGFSYLSCMNNIFVLTRWFHTCSQVSPLLSYFPSPIILQTTTRHKPTQIIFLFIATLL